MKKHILYIATIIAGTFITTPVFATTMDTNVNIRPSMTLSVSSNDISLDLNPATKPFDTKDLTITIGTNNPTGYKLYLNSDSTDLINTEDSSKTIETLPSSTPASGYDQSSFPANYWGYRKSNGSSSSGNYLPYESELLVSSSTGPSNETTTSIGLASKIDYLKESGTYSLDFKLNAIPTITQYYMQDLSDPTLAQEVCVAEHPTIVFDSRDDQAYSIRRINGICLMVQDLIFGYNSSNPSTTNITINPEDTNIDSIKTMTIYDLVTNGETECQTNGYRVPCAHYGINSSGERTAWYNFAMVSGYTVSDDIPGSTGVEARYDICPAGWKLPTLSEGETITATDDRDNFGIVYNGGYWQGILHNDSQWSYYHTSTFYNTNQQYVIYIRSNGQFGAGYVNVNRHDGLSMRCILK